MIWDFMNTDPEKSLYTEFIQDVLQDILKKESNPLYKEFSSFKSFEKGDKSLAEIGIEGLEKSSHLIIPSISN